MRRGVKGGGARREAEGGAMRGGKVASVEDREVREFFEGSGQRGSRDSLQLGGCACKDQSERVR